MLSAAPGPGRAPPAAPAERGSGSSGSLQAVAHGGVAELQARGHGPRGEAERGVERVSRARGERAADRPDRQPTALEADPGRAEKSSDRIGSRASPTRAVSTRRAGSITKSSRLTVVLPAVSEMPPLWRIVPVRSALRNEFVIGNASSPEGRARAGAIGAGVTPSPVSASAAAGSSASVVAP